MKKTALTIAGSDCSGGVCRSRHPYFDCIRKNIRKYAVNLCRDALRRYRKKFLHP